MLRESLRQLTEKIDIFDVNFKRTRNTLMLIGASLLVGACSVVKVTTPGKPENGNRATYQYYQETTNPLTGETSLSLISEQDATSGLNAYLEQKTMTPEQLKDIQQRELNEARIKQEKINANQKQLEQLRNRQHRE